MNSKRKALIAVAVVLALLVIGTAIAFRIESGSSTSESGGSKTPLGGLFSRAGAVSDLKQQMGDLRAFHPALMDYARAHNDDLPRTVAELRPYLPQKLAYLDDAHWEMPTEGKLSALMSAKEANSTVFLQEKDMMPGNAKIVVFADGHIEYRK